MSILLTLLALTPLPTPQNPPPAGWVDLQQHIPEIRCDIRYHTANNFTGAPLPGYGVPGAWLREEPADSLATVQKALNEQGLGLLVYDAYRPLRGSVRHLGPDQWCCVSSRALPAS